MLYLTFVGSFTMCPSFHSRGISSSSRIFSNCSFSILVDVSKSALSASAGVLSGPGELLFFMAFLISPIIDGLLQSTAKSSSESGMSPLFTGMPNPSFYLLFV